VVVCLGSTAAQALIGRDFQVSRQRGKFVDSTLAPHVIATVHPSSIFRVEDDEFRQLEFQALVADLKNVAPLLEKP
jgi:DNA polymerase